MTTRNSVLRMARDLERVKRDVAAIANQPRLPHSSIDGGSLTIRDQQGNDAGFLGEQFDGAYGLNPVGGTPPASPTIPFIQEIVGGLRIYWDGTYVDASITRTDFSRVTFYAVTDPQAFDPLDASQIVGEIHSATGGEVTVALPYVEHYIYAVAWTYAGKFSFESDPAFGTPKKVMNLDLDDEIDLGTGSDGNAPTAAPVVVGTGGFKTIYATWGRVTNADPVAYELATSAVDGFTPVEADIKVYTQANSAALPAEDPTYARVRAVDADGEGPWSDQVLITPISGLDEDALAAILADEATPLVINSKTFNGGVFNGNTFNGGEMNAVEMNGGIITGALYRSRVSGERLEIATLDDSVITFHSAYTDEYQPSSIRAYAGESGTQGSGLVIRAGRATSTTPETFLQLYSIPGESVYGSGAALAGPSLLFQSVKPGSAPSGGGASTIAKLSLADGEVKVDASRSISDTSPWAGQFTVVSRATRVTASEQVSIDAPSVLINGQLVNRFVGEVTMFAGTSIPADWMQCAWQLLAKASFPALWAAIGATYGGSTATHFRVPDFSGRVPMGPGTADASYATGVTLGSKGGDWARLMTTGEMASHTHTQDAHSHNAVLSTTGGFASGGASAAVVQAGGSFYTLAEPLAQIQITSATPAIHANGGGTAFRVVQPYTSVYFIIKYR